MKKTDCFICGSKNKKVIVKQCFKDKYLELINSKYNEITRKWVECDNCGFIYHYPMLDKYDTKALYDKFRNSSFRDESPDEYFDRIDKIPLDKSENHYKVLWLIENLKGLLSHTHCKVLDVGCGGGVFFAYIKELGFI